MSESSFDPFDEWLGIEEMPCSDWDLLGLADRDASRSEIENAYQRRYAQVRPYQVGPHSAEATSVLNEITAAYQRLTIGSVERKVLESTGQRAHSATPAPEETQGSDWDLSVPAEETEEPILEPKRFRKPKKRRDRDSTSSHRKAKKRSRVWHVKSPSGEYIGPLTRARLRKYVRRKLVAANALVWKRGWTTSMPVHAVFPEYFPIESAPPDLNWVGESPSMLPPVVAPTKPSRMTNTGLVIGVCLAFGIPLLLVLINFLQYRLGLDRHRGIDHQTTSPDSATNSRPKQKPKPEPEPKPKQRTNEFLEAGAGRTTGSTNSTNSTVVTPAPAPSLDQKSDPPEELESRQLRSSIEKELQREHDLNDLRTMLDFLRKRNPRQDNAAGDDR